MSKNKDLRFFIKSDEKEKRSFKGVLSHYNNIDRDGDIIVKGAFFESIANKNVVALLFNHQKDNPIGSLTLTETENGVECIGKLYDCESGNIAYELLKDGAISELSVGFCITEYDFIETGLSVKKGIIVEGSVVYMPSNPLAVITEVKTADSEEGEINMPTPNKPQTKTETPTPEVEQPIVIVADPIVLVEPVTKSAESNVANVFNQVKSTANKGITSSYLTSKEATTDFIKCVMGNPTKLEKAWTEHLATKGITNPSMVLPTAIATSINDKIKSGRLLPFINTLTGTDSYKIVDEKLNELGSGHNRTGTSKGKKKEQQIEFIEKLITTQYIYKMQVIGREIRKRDKQGTIYNFIVEELPNRLVKTIEKAIVIGDGLATSSEYKIKTYKAIIDDTAYYQKTLNATTDDITLENVFDKAPRYLREGEFVMITSKDYYYDLKGLRNSLNTKVYEHDFVTIAGNRYPTLDGTIIIVEDFMKDHETVEAVFLSVNAYRRIKDSEGFEKEETFDIDYNNEKILIETFEGGALEFEDSAVVITKAVTV